MHVPAKITWILEYDPCFQNNLLHLFLVESLEDNGPYSSFCLKTRFVGLNNKSANNFAVISHMILIFRIELKMNRRN